MLVQKTTAAVERDDNGDGGEQLRLGKVQRFVSRVSVLHDTAPQVQLAELVRVLHGPSSPQGQGLHNRDLHKRGRRFAASESRWAVDGFRTLSFQIPRLSRGSTHSKILFFILLLICVLQLYLLS